MASSSGQTKDLLRLYWWDSESGKKFFINFTSDSREDSSIKLAQCMIDRADLPETHGKMEQDNRVFEDNETQIKATIERSLIALYGNRMPKIYLTEDGKSLVMNQNIYENHCEHFLKLARHPSNYLFRRFCMLTLVAIQEHICNKVIREPDVIVNRRKFILDMDHRKLHISEPQGRRAKKDEICSLLLDTPYKPKQEPGGARSHLVSIGRQDESLRRSIFYNIVASDRANSIRLPRLIIKLSRLPRRGDAYLQMHPMTGREISEQVTNKVIESLERLHENERPVVHVCESSHQDLVIDVPVHVEHEPMFRKYLMGRLRFAFFKAITTYYSDYFLRFSQRGHLKSNESLLPFDSGTDFVRPARLANFEEICSLLMVPRGRPKEFNQSSLDWEFTIGHHSPMIRCHTSGDASASFWFPGGEHVDFPFGRRLV